MRLFWCSDDVTRQFSGWLILFLFRCSDSFRFRDLFAQYLLNLLLFQSTTVLGLAISNKSCHSLITFEQAIQNIRSGSVNRCFGLFRFKTISWCRSARFSITREFRCRSNPGSHFEIISIRSILRREPFDYCYNVNGISCDEYSVSTEKYFFFPRFSDLGLNCASVGF